MSDRTVSSVDARSIKKQEAMARVRAAAFVLITPDNYQRITVEAIASAAGVAPATVYRHFGTKDAIILWTPFDGWSEDTLSALMTKSDLPEVIVNLAAHFDGLNRDERQVIKQRINLAGAVPELRAHTLVRIERAALLLAEILTQQSDGSRPEHVHKATGLAAASALQCAVDAWAAGVHPKLEVLAEQAVSEIEAQFLL